MQCSISSQVPEEAVFSKTGYIFERRLIEKFIEETGRCPITGEPLSKEDLIPVKQQEVSVKFPRSSGGASLPQMLSQFQDEWDGFVLQSHKLKEDLEVCQQELAVGLYQNDAAKRTIVRLIRERDEARAKLTEMENMMQEIVRKQVGRKQAVQQAEQKAAQEAQQKEQQQMEERAAKKAKLGITNEVLQVNLDPTKGVG
eukprot:TRINITY_DN96177_c0_g1_i1.p1 TRINITY_DN96177_c0_g1~~TRINITY_DN96177_c0_g1_i1.p1  ORF type:complete len:211 (-),score=28.13 TRINITY_DN96177_c0_g1_i1:8-604(-)